MWQAQYFGDVFRRCVAVFVAGAALWTCIVILRGRRSTLDVSCHVFFVNRSGMAASSGDKVQIPSKTRRKTSSLKLYKE